MNWYKQSKVAPGNYLLGINGELIPCHSRSFKDCMPTAASRYNILTNNQNPNSDQYFREVMDNGIALLTLNNGVSVNNRKALNANQQATVRALQKNRK